MSDKKEILSITAGRMNFTSFWQSSRSKSVLLVIYPSFDARAAFMNKDLAEGIQEALQDSQGGLWTVSIGLECVDEASLLDLTSRTERLSLHMQWVNLSM